jgi:antitoxin component YwqK of YwqJK toxin-antitoxin module
VSHVTHAANTAPSDAGGWLLFSTIAPTMGITWSVNSTTEGIAEWYYEETSCLNRIKASETAFFALENFDQMQQERFYTDKPYIEAFAELTSLSSTDIEALLASSQADLSSEKFLTATIQQMSKKIMDTSASLEEKTLALSKILLIDGEVADAIEDNDSDELYELLGSCQESDGEYDYALDNMGRIMWETYSTEVGELTVKQLRAYEGYGGVEYQKPYQLIGEEGTFINGVPYDGLIRSYDSDNCRLSDINYKDGKMEGLAKFYYYNREWYCPIKQLEHEVNYKDGKATGLVKYYNTDGSLAGEGTFIDDLPQDGFIRFYSSGGSITREMIYKDGKLNGLAKFYKAYEWNKTDDNEADDKTFSLNASSTYDKPEYIASYENNKLVSGSCTIEVSFDMYEELHVEFGDVAGQIKENAELDEYVGIIDEVSDYYDEYDLKTNFKTGKYSCYTPIIEGKEGATRIMRKYVDLP